MKIKQILLTGTLLVSVASFSQKDELKTLKKIYAREVIASDDLVDFKENLTKLEPLATEEGDKIYANFYKSMLPILELNAAGKNVTQAMVLNVYSPKAIEELAKGLNATLEYEKKLDKKLYTDDIVQTIGAFKPQMINFAVRLAEGKKEKEAADMFYAIYLLDKKDQEKLYYAASYAVNAQDYDKALIYYSQLKELNYTGEGTVYWAVNTASQTEESFPSKVLREQYVKLGTHERPRDEKLPSQRGEIYKNIALILVQQGKVEEAKKAIVDAREANPDDTSLMMAEANFYLTQKDNATYSKLVSQILEKDPTNPELNFNLGVLSAEGNEIANAENYYKKAIELKADYFEAYLNLSELKLRADEKMVTEMNKLGTSDKDNKRYEVLKIEREKNFKSVLPYLEKAVELKPDNEDAKRALLSVYNALEMTDKYKALKAKL